MPDFTCGTCWRAFPAGFRARDTHCKVKGHQKPPFECDSCSEYFADEWERRDHMDYEEHWKPNSPKCDVCHDSFPTEQERNDHYVDIHRYCADCMRFFRNQNGIRQHLNSRRHRQSVVRCPFCNTSRGSATGLIHHVERGCCHTMSLDRTKLYKSVRARDPHGHITIKSLERLGETVYEVTDKAWNPWHDMFECYLCHRLFQRLDDLRQHLGSPAHQQSLYHCPNDTCPKDFSTLAALINHLESETCGYMRFQAVQTNVEKLVSSDRRIEL